MPTRDAAAYAILTLLLLFVAVNLQAGWVYAVDALLIGFAIAGWVTTYAAVRPLPVSRSMPAEVVEGGTFPVTLCAGPVRWTRFFVQITDEVPGCDPGGVFIPGVGRRAEAVTYRTTARRRGVHTVTSLEVRSEGVSGLFRLRRALAVPGAITILPRYTALRSFPLPGRRGQELTPFPQPARTGVDVAGVRDFRVGDDPARIHWRSTARRGHLVVREFEREVMSAAALIIDSRPLGDPEGFEDLIRAAASVSHFITHRGMPAIIAFSRGSRAAITTTGWMDSLRALAAVERDGELTPADLCAALPPGTPAVVFTPSADAAAAVAAGGTPVTAVLAGTESSGGLLLAAMGVPVRVLRPGEEIGACLES